MRFPLEFAFVRPGIVAPLAFVAALDLAAPAAAQGWMSGDGGMDLSIGAGSYLLSQQVLKGVADDSRAQGAGTEKQGDTGFSRSGGYDGSLDFIVSLHPEPMQAEARLAFGELLEAYPKVIRELGQSENDLAVGMAAFIAGGYSGFHNIPFPDEKFAPLVTQMREGMESDPNIAILTEAEKQRLNDILAAVGMQLAIVQNGLQTAPDPALAEKLRETSRQYFQEVLGVAVEDVQITSVGMIL